MTEKNDVTFFKKKGARLMPSFRRGHKRILRYINLEWKNPLLRTSLGLDVARDTEDSFVLPPLADGPVTSINVRISTNLEAAFLTRLQNPEVKQRQTNTQDGNVTIQVKVPMSDDIERIVLSYGTDIEVLGPVSFRSKIRRTINELQKIYKKETAAETAKPVQGDLFGEMSPPKYTRQFFLARVEYEYAGGKLSYIFRKKCSGLPGAPTLRLCCIPQGNGGAL